MSTKFKDFKIVTLKEQVDKQTSKPNFITRNIVNEDLSILEMIYSYPILIGSIILQNSKVHMYNYLYKIYPKLFEDNYKVLYMDTDSIYSKLNMTHAKYFEILEKKKDLFGKNIGQMDLDFLNNKIKEAIFLSSKCYSYICKNDIPKNLNKMKNNILHTKGISYSYTQQFIDQNLFKETLLNNNKPDKIIFNTISIKKQKFILDKLKKII